MAEKLAVTGERRRFFRIEDTLGVAYQLLSDEELAVYRQGFDRPMDMFSLLANYEVKIEKELSILRVKDPLIASVLDNISCKINCVINQMEMDSQLVRRVVHKFQPVSISACGMGLLLPAELEVGQVLSFDLILAPTNLHVFTLGAVVACEPCEDEPEFESAAVSIRDNEEEEDAFFVRIEFQEMEDEDQEVLIQHVVKRQSTLFRDARLSKKKQSSIPA